MRTCLRLVVSLGFLGAAATVDAGARAAERDVAREQMRADARAYYDSEMTTGFLFLGFASLFADFKGGSLGPTPDVLIVLPTGSGTLDLPSGMPAGAPGNFSFYLQMWTPDAGGPHGADATNTLQATTPP